MVLIKAFVLCGLIIGVFSGKPKISCPCFDGDFSDQSYCIMPCCELGSTLKGTTLTGKSIEYTVDVSELLCFTKIDGVITEGPLTLSEVDAFNCRELIETSGNDRYCSESIYASLVSAFNMVNKSQGYINITILYGIFVTILLGTLILLSCICCGGVQIKKSKSQPLIKL